MTERALPVTILEPAGIDPELLDHSLSLRFDLGQFDPRITFTRNSSATYFGSDGLLKTASANAPRIDYDPVTGECKGFLVEESRTNLLTYSDRIDLWGRSTSNMRISEAGIVSVDGVPRMYKLETLDGAGAITASPNTFPVTSGKTYVASAYVKPGNHNSVGITFRNMNSEGWQTGSIKLSETYVADTSVGAQWKFGGCTYVGNGIYRVWSYCTANQSHAAANVDFRIGTDFGETLVAGSHVFIGKVQCEEATFPTSYIPTPAAFTSRNSTGTYFDSTGVMRTAAINEARYDHALVDGKWVSKGLMLEGSRTNLFPRSEELNAWSMNPSPNDAIILPNATVAPDGTTTADKHVPTTTSGVHSVYRTFAGGINKTYTASVFVKAAEYGYASVGLGNSGFINVNNDAVFDLSTGALVFTRGAPIQASSTKLNDGWWRISISALSDGDGGVYVASASSQPAPTISAYAGDGVSGVYIWGMQVEEIPAGESLLPTSYIKTEAASVTRAADLSTSSAATRAADSAVMAGTNFSSWYRQDEGTMVAEINDLRVGSGVTSNAGIFDVRQSAGDPINTRMLRAFSGVNGGLSLQISDANGVTYNPADSGGVLTSVDQFGKVGLAYKWGDDAVASEMGLLSANRTLVGAAPLAASVLYIGSLNNGSQFQSTRHIKRLSYYPKRLPNAQLQALTQ